MADYVGEKFTVQTLYNTLFGYVAPPFPAFLESGDQLLPSNPLTAIQANFDQFKKSVLNVEMIFPLKLSIPDFEYELPFEPMISMSGGNNIVKRYPLRNNSDGSVKERWSQKDYSITIKGFLLDLNDNNYPEDQVSALRRFLEYAGSIKAECTLLRLFGIEYITINDHDVPFTPGKNIQEYSIIADSDKLFNSLLIQV